MFHVKHSGILRIKGGVLLIESVAQRDGDAGFHPQQSLMAGGGDWLAYSCECGSGGGDHTSWRCGYRSNHRCHGGLQSCSHIPAKGGRAAQ